MTSSTDVLSNGSFQEGHNDTANTPHHGRSTSDNGALRPTEEVQDEIDAMIASVPQVDEVFTIINKIGSGTFSSVYVAKLKNHPEISSSFALKHIIPTSHPSRIESELRCLHEIGGADHVMDVKACFRERDHVVIVMPYFPHDKFQDYVQVVTVTEVREYMLALLVALNRVHAVDIIHRDVKPSNFLFNRQLKKYALVDFGLAQKAPVPLKQSTGGPQEELKKPVKQTQDENSRLTKRLGISADLQAKNPSQKRKSRGDDVENQPEKKHMAEKSLHSRSASVGLATIDTNKKTMSTISENKNILNKETSMNSRQTTNPGLLKPSYMKTSGKSPRRVLLTKRTLEKRGITLFDQPGANGKDQGKGSVVVMEKNGKKMYKMMAPTSCQCYGRPVICSICMSRSSQHAPRAGTPGFRAPEVLLKCPEQTTAVDIWSAGVIFLSLLSGRYPFFKAPDDLTALAQIISVLGSDEMQSAAQSIGKNLLCNPKTSRVNIRIMCKELRKVSTQRNIDNKDAKKSSKSELVLSEWANITDSAYDLLEKLLDVNPKTRITADAAISHPFFTENS